MAIPQNKKQLVEAIILNSTKLKIELQTIPESLSRIKNMDGHSKGTKMSVCDLLAYLIGWGELVLKWNTNKDRDENVDFPETNYKWNELGKLAQKFYKDYEKDKFSSLIKRFNKVVQSILELVEKKTNVDLYQKSWYEKWTLGRMIQLNTSSPYQNAKARLRKWKKENSVA